MRMILAIVMGAALTVAPARAQESDVMPIPLGHAICDADGPNCIVARATLIASHIAFDIAAKRIKQLERDIARLEGEAKHPSCAKVEKIPVPGTRS